MERGSDVRNAPSSSGRTMHFDCGNRGSNPRGAAKIAAEIVEEIVALGWFALLMGCWFWLAHRAYVCQSGTLWLIAFGAMVAAVGGSYFILLWMYGFLG